MCRFVALFVAFALPCAALDTPFVFAPSGQTMAIGYPDYFSYFLANSGNLNVIGPDQMHPSSGVQNTAAGKWALQNCAHCYNNTAIGALSQYYQVDGFWNTGVGVRALMFNVASYNTAVGVEALRYNTIGAENSAFGVDALQANVDGMQNSAFGKNALWSNVSGNYNAAFGREALYNNTGSFNSAVGMWGLWKVTTGWQNTACGTYAGQSIVAGSLNTMLGYKADVASDISNAIAIGANAVASQSNTAVIGDANVNQVSTAQAWAVGGIKVIGPRGAAVADATSLVDVVAQLNAALARLRAHGLIAP